MLHHETMSIWLVYIVTGIWNGQTTNSLAESCSSYNYGAIRLVGGATWKEGRVEICLNSSEWGTVCDDYWEDLDAQVTCRQLGYNGTGAVPLISAHFGPGTGPIHIGSASCDGSEQRIVDCQLRYENECLHIEDAGVNCPLPCSPHGGVRLTGSTPGRGTVEICLNGTWGTVCDNYWNVPDAEVVCRQLGYDGHDAQAYTSALFGEGYGPILLDYVNCNGDEASLLNCDHKKATNQCDHSSDAGVNCTAPNKSGNLETMTISHSQLSMYISSMLITWSSSSSHSKLVSTMLSLIHKSTAVSILTQTSFVSLVSQSKTTSTANASSPTLLHTFAVSSTASFGLQLNSLISTEDIKPLSSSELLTALRQANSFQTLHTSPSSTIAAGPTSSLSLKAMPTLELTQTEYTQLSFMITSHSSAISDVESLPLSLTSMPTLTQTTSTWLLFTSPSSTSAQDNQSSVAIGVSVAVVILCIAAVVVTMIITIAVYLYRRKYHIFTRSIVEDPQLKDMYTKYEDTHTLIDNKQAQEEHVVNPLADGDNDDNDVDHEQIELRPVMVESEPADDLHAFKTQTSSADLEPTKPTDSVISSETHVDTHDDTTAMSLMSWDPESEHDVEGENMELQLIQKQQSAAGSSPHASATSVLSDSAYGGTQPQGDGQQQGRGADNEEMELREIDDDSF